MSAKIYDCAKDELVEITQDKVDRLLILAECYGVMNKLTKVFYGDNNKLFEIVKDLSKYSFIPCT